ncbi:hypothetical protein HanHA89_Chr01g0002791 [Helianthus annuus]|nr:hypothetical protein HanHA89_Chr01g0002791 [Helianthus annuus]
MTCRNSSVMADHQSVEFHESRAQGLPWLPTYILNDGVETCANYVEDDYRFFSKRRSVLNDGLEASGEDDFTRFGFCSCRGLVSDEILNYLNKFALLEV